MPSEHYHLSGNQILEYADSRRYVFGTLDQVQQIIFRPCHGHEDDQKLTGD